VAPIGWRLGGTNCVVPKIGVWVVPIGRRLDGSKRQETVCYAEVGGWLVPRGMRLVGTRCLCYRC